MQLKLTLAASCLFLLLGGCKKEIMESNLGYAALDPIDSDEDAGNWKPILLSAANEIGVPAPDSVKSTAYLAELNEIKSWQQEISTEEEDLIRYWSAGAVLRWNEITRELVARHNIPPQENPDGSYPVPSAGNPFAYPSFPFSNPPYAARAYAYVSAAQYDALLAAFYYKKLYQRAAPYVNDKGVEALVPENTLGAYPSEDAAVIGATVEILKLLFPADQDYIQQKAEEHRRARLIAGANVRSDLNAGEALGKAVAQKFTARARTDKAGSAVGNEAYWESLKLNAQQYGLTPWQSMESPARPPMLPLFGRVNAFLFDSATLVTSLRPVPPPLPGTLRFNEELAEVAAYSKKLSRENLAIVHFWADGINTYTPPGHWNAIAAGEFVAQRYSEVRWARNLALLNLSMMDAAIACWDTKFHFFNARPSQIDPAIKTWTGLPNFPSYTSGHSTFSGAAATVLSHLIPGRAGHFNSMASEASMSRLYGAIHFRSDCEEGLKCGQRIGELAVQRALTDGAE
jgi:hypothetical protein